MSFVGRISVPSKSSTLHRHRIYENKPQPERDIFFVLEARTEGTAWWFMMEADRIIDLECRKEVLKLEGAQTRILRCHVLPDMEIEE